MDQHPVPQHIASFEFKLFGNLTVRQFITLAIPLGLATLIFFSSLHIVPRLLISGLIALLGFYAALIPVGGRPLDKWLVSFIHAILSPTQRLWIKEPKIPEYLIIVTTPPTQKEEIPQSITAQGRERLRQYLRSLPKGELAPLDVKEQIALERLGVKSTTEGLPSETFLTSEALAKEVVKEGKLPPPIIWPTSQPYLKTGGARPESIYDKESEFQEEIQPTISRRSIRDITPEEYPTTMNESLLTHQTPLSNILKVATHAKPFILQGIEKRLAQQTQKTSVKAQLASEANFAVESVIPIKTPDRQIRLIHGVGKTRVRKLHFAPPAGFDLSKLPVRGERRFEISEELKKRYHLDENLFAEPNVVGPSQTYDLPNQNTGEPQTPPQAKHAPTTTIPKATADAEKAQTIVPKPQKETSISQNVSLKEDEKNELDSRILIKGQKQQSASTSQTSNAQMVPLTAKPNVLSGIITSPDGTPLENIILIVRDQQGIPVRAFKTNRLGQFLSATSLPNGNYTVEMESESAKLAPFTVELKGQILSPMEVKATPV